jgi:hypothetical protein
MDVEIENEAAEFDFGEFINSSVQCSKSGKLSNIFILSFFQQDQKLSFTMPYIH